MGKVLEAPSRIWDFQGILQGEHFSQQILRDIYDAIYLMSMEGKSVTLRTIQARVGAEYDEDGKSTMTLMTALIRDVEGLESVDSHVSIVVDLWRRRRTIEIAKQFAAEAMKPSTDSSYMLTDLENCIKDISTNSQEEPLLTIGQHAAALMERSAETQRTGRVVAINPGLPSLYEIMGSIHPGDLGYVIAPQGGGKTVIGLQFLKGAAEDGFAGLMEQLEMKGQQMAARSLAAETSLAISDIEEGAYDMYGLDALREAVSGMANLPIYIDDRPLLTIEKIREKCTTLKRKKGLGMVVIDHMRLVQTNKRIPNRFDRIEYVSSSLKAMAKDLDIAVIGLSQVTRASQRRDDPFPSITDSDVGSAVEQDADWAIALFRRETWLKKQKPLHFDAQNPDHNEWAREYSKWKGKIEIRCLKRRRGVADETREFGFDGARYRIFELGDRA